jgi:regulator of sirC expression with transglutaminase-like and TPR domain
VTSPSNGSPRSPEAPGSPGAAGAALPPRASRIRERFAQLASLDDDRVDPILGALLVAAEADPSVVVEDGLARLDELARRGAPRLAAATDPHARVDGLCRFLRDEGFRGNREDYYDPRNSYLHEVLRRRTGIPISLALVYLAVARRYEWPLLGVSFPGHFLLKYVATIGRARETIVIDPFDATVLGEDDLHARAKAALGAGHGFTPQLLRGASGREILVRVLGNLKQVHVQRRDFPSALACVERILLLEPDAWGELRDRGLLYNELECHGAARADLERYLELQPGDPAADALRELLLELREKAGRLH